MDAPLSPYKQAKAREVFNLFTLLNSASWTFIAANTVTLFALRCGASSTAIGFLSSMAYISYFFLPIGKLAVKYSSIVRVFSVAWIVRSICMIPVIFAPFAALLGYNRAALILLTVSVALFHVFRGIGMVSNNPVLNFLSAGPDQSSYMTQTQVINNAVSMFAGFLVALCLGGAGSASPSSILMYALISLAGIICGISSGVLIRKIPEPPAEPAGQGPSLPAIFKKAFTDLPIRYFILIFFLVALCSGVARIFIVVYAREVFLQNDGLVSLYGVFGAFGSFLIGLCIKFLVTRIGAKPLFIMCIVLGLVSILALIFMRAGQNTASAQLTILTFSLLFLLINFAFIGAENVGQTYFICMVPKELVLDMSVLYFVVFGVAGASGSLLSGLVLDMCDGFGWSRAASFKLLFAILALCLLAALAFQRKLISMGALPVKDALFVIFSFRDLRAISILDKLEKSEDAEKEQALIAALQEKPSRMAISGLLDRAKSPRFATRTEAFEAMSAQQSLNEEAEKALMDDVRSNPYTTAYQSARILGLRACAKAVPVLRQAVYSDDYMLSGEAMIALARLGDAEYRTVTEEIIGRTVNPRLQLMGVEAFGIYRSVHSLPMLFRMLKTPNPPPYLPDEAALSMANILDIYNRFHKLLVRYLANPVPAQAEALALDEAESACEYAKNALSHVRVKNRALKAEADALRQAAAGFLPAVAALTRAGGQDAAPVSQWMLRLPDVLDCAVKALILSEAIIQDDIRASPRLQLLIVQWSARMLRRWTDDIRGRL